jgi:hypothetical protein
MHDDPGDPIWPSDTWDDGLDPVQRWRARWADRRADLTAGSATVDRACAFALRQGFVLTNAQARAAGLIDAELRSLVRRREWSSPRRGVLAVIHPDTDAHAHAALAATAAALVRANTVVSHESAAILHGLPVLREPGAPILTIAPHAPIGRAAGAEVHRATLPRARLSEWYGAPMSDVARTVADIARRDLKVGLVTADAALRFRLTSSAALTAAALECQGWPGARRAAWVAEQADPLAESPLESLARACLLIGGVPAPQLQGRIRAADGWRCRVDMLWPEQRVIAEMDGRVKYRQDDGALRRSDVKSGWSGSATGLSGSCGAMSSSNRPSPSIG